MNSFQAFTHLVSIPKSRSPFDKLRANGILKCSTAVFRMIEGQAPNTVELSNLLPLATDRQDMREQWLRRLLKSPALRCETVMAPFAQAALKQAGQNGQVILLSMDQTDLGDRMAVLMITVRVGDRSLPLAWLAEEGAANIGFAKQKILLDGVLPWLPDGAKVMLLADRFYPSIGLFQWLIAMDCPLERAAVLDYGSRWAIEPTFSDFKGRGFQLEDSQLEHADRLERLILIMALAMHWCVRIGQDDAAQRPTPLEKKRTRRPISSTGVSENATAACCPGSHGDCGI